MLESAGVIYQRLSTQINYVFVLLVFMAGLWHMQQWLQQPTTMPIKHVRIEGELRNVSKTAVSKSLDPLVRAGYFSMDSEAILAKLTELEWVADARVMRVWPDTIVLSFNEQTAIAVWNADQLLNKHGDVFKPEMTQTLLELPHLSGRFDANKTVLNEQQRINSAINELGLSVTRLDLAEHGSWSAELSNGMAVKAGKQRPAQRISKSLAVLSSLKGNLLAHIESIDLRYPNGVAVTWHDGYKLGGSKGKSESATLKTQRLIKG